ncbi:unnamed protein product [Penicillium salamii]|nr:unnamed protein product [Penicillium salamii]
MHYSYLRPNNILLTKTAPTTLTTQSTCSIAALNNDIVIYEKFNSSIDYH